MSPTRRPRNPHADIDFTLRRVFGKSSFRPIQRDIVNAALEGRDVFVQAATSFGKSLCYQLPAVIEHGITIVISPLLALMGNQVAALKAANITVATINSTTSFQERDIIIKDLSCGHPKTRLLYITPELMLTESFRRVVAIVYSHGELTRIAVDEAHCISEWGHEFRPAYCHLSYVRQAYPSVPIMCLTATATLSVRSDIMNILGLKPTTTASFVTTTTRQNLHYHIRFVSDEADERFDWLLSFFDSMRSRRSGDLERAEILGPGEDLLVPGIIYVPYRADCDALASRLRQHGIGAAPYHAGLNASQRNECQQKWLEAAAGMNIIVATTAFGMGIDKENVRFVIHWSLPKSFEGFYQEAGRAGRDGKAALCLLFYSREDRDRASYRIGQRLKGKKDAGESGKGALAGQLQARAGSFQALIKYCEQTDRCRHVVIGEYFGEKDVGLCHQACDVCFCKVGEPSAAERKTLGLSSEEWVSTQRQHGNFEVDEYD